MGRIKSISSFVVNFVVLVIDRSNYYYGHLLRHHLLQWNTRNNKLKISENLNVLLIVGGWLSQINILKQEAGLSKFHKMVVSG